jgi:hypothetical protein
MEERRNKIRRDISTIPGKGLHRVKNNVFRRYTEEGNIFSFCCRTGECLSDFLRDIITAILCVAICTES